MCISKGIIHANCSIFGAQIVNAALWLLGDASLVGTVVVLMNTGATFVIEEPRGSLKKCSIPALLVEGPATGPVEGGAAPGGSGAAAPRGAVPKSTRAVEVHRCGQVCCA